MQVWEYGGRFLRKVPVASATVDLVQLRLDGCLVTRYPLFIPPQSGHRTVQSIGNTDVTSSLQRSVSGGDVIDGGSSQVQNSADIAESPCLLHELAMSDFHDSSRRATRSSSVSGRLHRRYRSSSTPNLLDDSYDFNMDAAFFPGTSYTL